MYNITCLFAVTASVGITIANGCWLKKHIIFKKRGGTRTATAIVFVRFIFFFHIIIGWRVIFIFVQHAHADPRQ